MTERGDGAFLVEFRDGARTARALAPSSPVVDPPGVTVLERSDRRVVYGQPSNDGASSVRDPVVGSLPFVTMDGNQPILCQLALPSPPPFGEGDVDLMWQQVVASDVPVPASVPLQGRLPRGVTSPSDALLVDALQDAHSAARALLARWPAVFGRHIAWRPIDLPGGRENIRLTERDGGRRGGVPGPQGVLPSHSARWTSPREDWRSAQLSSAAGRLASRVAEESTPVGRDLRSLVAPFADVAARSGGRNLAADPPLSSWPYAARVARTKILRALAIVDGVDPTQTSEVSAPLCYLWRLYEAWVATRIAEAIDACPGATLVAEPTQVPGAEWVARWLLPHGVHVVLVAQAQIPVSSSWSDPPPHAQFTSISSDLRPDVLLLVRSALSERAYVFDAKQRSGAFMDGSAVAEAASKYVWGIRRRHEVGGALAGIAVEEAVVVTTARAPVMYDDASRIRAVQVRPREEAALQARVAAMVSQP